MSNPGSQLAGVIITFALTLSAAPFSQAAEKNQAQSSFDATTQVTSPVRKIRKSKSKAEKRNRYYRPIDGSNNHHAHKQMNAAHTQLRRYLNNNYADGQQQMAGQHLPSPRAISNAVFAQTKPITKKSGPSDFVWQWGQFLDHDLDLTDGQNPPESWPISIPKGDLHFDPHGTGTVLMPFNRSIYSNDYNGVRQQVNEISGWIDASNVYGSDVKRARALRTLDGTGRLKTSEGKLLPYNVDQLPNAGGDSESLFLAGDVRANEQVGLIAMHTLFVREHNRWANILRRENPRLSGEAIYQRARALVAAQMQIITYKEFLPALLGKNPLPRYRGFKKHVDARIMNEFSSAAYRLGHSMLSPTLKRLNRNLQEIPGGHLSLRSAFFAPQEVAAHGIAPVFRGLAHQVCQPADALVIDDVRNFLFGQPGHGGFDLVALNIQRGRDHGLPSYNDARRGFGLKPARNFEEISSNPATVNKLRSVYNHVNEIDFWVGGLAEDTYHKGMLGQLFRRVVKRQMRALRDGDNYWYKRSLSKRDRARVEHLRLADIIRLNTSIGREIPNNVFYVKKKRRNGLYR